MEDYLDQLYEHINNKNEEYEKMLEQYYMDKFNITKEKLEYLKEYLECDKFIICNKVNKINGFYINCYITDLNLSSRTHEKNCLYSLSYYDLLDKYKYLIYKSNELNLYFIQCYNDYNFNIIDFILILNKPQIIKFIRLLNTVNKDNQKIKLKNIQDIDY